MTKFDGWDEEVQFIGGQPREFLEQLISETDLPSPDQWDSYDILINESAGTVSAMITDNDGVEHSVTESGIPDFGDVDDWDWVWDLWDWILENYPDVDLDSQYEEKG